MSTTATLPLLSAGDLDAPLAWRDGIAISRRQYLADVTALAARLPARGSVLNLALDRYRFAVALGAAMTRGHTSLLPPNRTPDTIARLRARFDDLYAIAEPDAPDSGLPTVLHPSGPAATSGDEAIPSILSDLVAARVLTSGSTGEPVPHPKPWSLLVASACAESYRLAQSMGLATLEGVALVATVPPQHMYGFESTVLVALQGGAAFDAGRPFFAADIADALAHLPRPRMLVTTPFHLKVLLDADLPLAAADLVVCATAPLSPQLAARAEAALAAPLVEIYGCTEAGQVATRRTTGAPEWRTFANLRLEGDGERTTVVGGHVPQPTVLADVLEVLAPERFRLLGRSNDLVNIAGKRSSLGHLNHHLNSIEGVVDGAFWAPPGHDDDAQVTRLVAFVVAPRLSREALLGALRTRIDSAFLPRRIVHVASLPRDPSGKLPADRLARLAAGSANAAPGAAPDRPAPIAP